MDKYITDELANKAISEVNSSEFDFKKFEMKNERLKSASKELLEMRCDLYLKFTKQFIKASNTVDLSGKIKKGSLTYNLLRCKALALNSAKNKVMTDAIERLVG